MRAHLYRTATDSAGNRLPNVEVTVYKAGSTQLVDQILYIGNTGSTTLANPFLTSTGIIDFYLDLPQSVKIGLSQGTAQNTIDNLEVTPAPENLVQSTTGFIVSGTPDVGQFLQCTAPGQAAWVSADDLISTKASPLSTLKSYDFSGSSMGDLVAQNPSAATVTPTYVDVTADAKPPTWVFTKAVKFPVNTPVILRLPAVTLPETGSLTFLYKVVAAATGIGAATARASVDSGLVQLPLPNDPGLLNQWNVAYLGDIPTGTHSVRIEQIPGTSPTSYVLFGPILLQYGNNIPFHTHGGTGVGSTVLGPSALAAWSQSTVVGGLAEALGDGATSYGYSAQAAMDGVAVGAYSEAGSGGVALGYYSTNLTGTSGGVAVGHQAQTLGDNATAVGFNTTGSGARSVALGSIAQAAGIESVAIGYSADALAEGGVALGSNSLVNTGHTNSVALGPGAITTAANQAVLGTATTTVVVPGDLQASGSAALAGAAGTLGFFGSAGTIRPTVTGSRSNNSVLTDLLVALDAMGLIVDGSTT